MCKEDTSICACINTHTHTHMHTHIYFVKRVNAMSSYYRKNFFFPFFFLFKKCICMRRWMSGGPVVAIILCVIQTTILYALNLHSDICQLFHNTSGEKSHAFNTFSL